MKSLDPRAAHIDLAVCGPRNPGELRLPSAYWYGGHVGNPKAGNVNPRNIEKMAFAGLIAGYILFAGSLSNAPMQDMPDHLTRAHIIGDLLFNAGASYGGYFDIQIGPYSYLYGDLLLATLDHYLGTGCAARIWIALSVALLPWATWFVAREHGFPRISAATASLLALYLATDRFFVAGFLYFQLGMACALFSYGWYLRAKYTHSRSAYVYFATFLLAGYGVHLSALIFSIAMTGTSSAISLMRRRMTLQQAAGLMLLPALLFAIYLLFGHPGGTEAVQPSIWASLQQKLQRIATPIVRFQRLPEYGLFIMFSSVALLGLSRAALKTVAGKHDLLAFPLLFFALYLAMPRNGAGAIDVDNRALPYLFLSLIFLGSATDRSRPMRQAQFFLALLVAGANLAYVSTQMLPQNLLMGRYKLIAAQIPYHAAVLPIYAAAYTNRYDPMFHAGSYATLESSAITPYLFAADKTPPQSYFHYKSREPAPSEFWYGGTEGLTTWSQVAMTYRYLLITVPWDPAVIRVPYEVLRSNDSAALLEIDAAAR